MLFQGGMSLTAKIAPSLMCANLGRLEDDIRSLEQIGVEYLHLDIMDGHFVPNFTLGPDFLRAVRDLTSIPVDIHLMVEKPENYIEMFSPQPGDIVCIHQEATYHLQRVLQTIKDLGAKPGVAINPATPLAMVKEVLQDVDMLLIMTVNPGYAGQKLVTSTLAKIKEASELINQLELTIEIEVDGNVSFANARLMRQAGADIFVAGSSSLFRKDLGFDEAARILREAIV